MVVENTSALHDVRCLGEVTNLGQSNAALYFTLTDGESELPCMVWANCYQNMNIDLFEFYRICSSDPGIEEITEYMPWDPHQSVKETAEFVDSVEQQWTDDEAATYVFRLKDSEDGAGDIAGLTTLSCDWDRRTGGLGMWLRKRFWGRGNSGERAAALMEIAFERLDLEVVAVAHHVDNEKSQRAIEKYVEAHGGQCDGLLRNWIPYDDDVADEYRYTVTRNEYQEAVQ